MVRPRVVIELADNVRLARDLAAGGVFVRDCMLDLHAECNLVVRVASNELEVDARVVFVDPAGGAGLELVGFGTAMREQLAALVGQALAAERMGLSDTETPTSSRIPELVDLAALDPYASAADDFVELVTPADFYEHTTGDFVPPEDPTEPDDGTPTEPTPDLDASADGAAPDAATDAADEAEAVRRGLPKNHFERLRGLTIAQQLKAANSADPQERIILERIYGKNVWEPLLRNPRLTAPEVVRIARMGTLPRVLLEVIVGNGGWLAIPEVRRALLGNPRLGADQIARVLRLLPKHELKLASSQTAYPMAVRDAAKRLLRSSS